MQAVRRLASGDPGMLADAGMAIAGAGLIAVAEWNPASLAGTRIAGPPWLLALLPVLIGAAMALRRRAPLLMWLAIWAGVVAQVLVTRHPLQSLYFIVVVFAAAYSLGAHAAARRAAAALAITAPAMALISHLGGVGTGLSLIPILIFWLAGVLVRARRQSGALATQNVGLRRQAEQAAAAERARIARELHDIIAHHLSVIVLQATAAQKPGRPAGPALRTIENSGRQALTETRRMLGVLHGTDEAPGLAPQPGIGELGTLAGTVRAAGLPVSLVIDGDSAAVPAAVDVSVYRIVQEALTNVLKHAGPARADVTIGCAAEAVTIEITDNGTGERRDRTRAGGHGLGGMRERAAIFGGQFHAGPGPGGGFTVRARLPLKDSP
jgi:signal transduction histidine kinase